MGRRGKVPPPKSKAAGVPAPAAQRTLVDMWNPWMQPPQIMYGMAGAMHPQVYGSMPPMMPNQFGMPPMMHGMPRQAGFPQAGAMQGAPPPGGMMGHQPSMPCQAQPPQEPPDSCRRSRSRSPWATRFPHIPSFPDDDGRLSSAYRSAGCVHVHGVKRAFPKQNEDLDHRGVQQ